MKKLVYVAGPYRGNIKKNIENAEKKTIELIRQGFDVLTPHKNSAGYEQYEDEEIPHRTWLDMGLNLLSRCDVLHVMKNAEKSEGTQAEIAFALKYDMEIIKEVDINNIILKGGNLRYGVYAGVFACTALEFQRELQLIPYYKRDMDGLPDRWVRISNGETNRIPKRFRL